MNESIAIVIIWHLSPRAHRPTKHPAQTHPAPKPASQGVYEYQITDHISSSSTTWNLQHLYPIFNKKGFSKVSMKRDPLIYGWTQITGRAKGAPASPLDRIVCSLSKV